MTYLYFIQAGAPDGPIKIGIADDPDERMTFLQVGNATELVLLAVMRASQDAERATHQRFAAGRIRGEWFRADTPGLRELVAHVVQAEADHHVDGARRMCRHCGFRPVVAPRTAVCSARCARDRRRATSSRWRATRQSAVPVFPPREGPETA